MVKPIVAIIGRPNVGKSTLFNRIVGKRIAIVEDTPGVTRDRIYADAEWFNHKFILIDTGGIEPSSGDKIFSMMQRQAQIAIETSDVIIFVTDAKDGITHVDEEVASILRRTSKPVVIAVNKVDNKKMFNEVYEFFNLGMGEPIGISSTLGLGIGDLIEKVISYFDKNNEEDEKEDAIKVAIAGKPNVGKSSLTNRLLKEERMIVSDIPGTTRDAVDTPVTINNEKFIFIDTAGIRRKSRVNENIERYSVIRAFAAIERADVCVIMIDAGEGITEQDTKIAGYAHEAGKGIVIAVNKWDIIKKDNKVIDEYTSKIRNDLSFMPYAPIVFISAKTGHKIDKLIEMVKLASKENAARIKSGTLNDIISDAVMMKQPPSDKGRRLKISYAVQSSIKPPTFVLFVNDPEIMHFSYERYLENQLRKRLGFDGTPIRFIYRKKGEKG
ncbi:MAG: ribosome biogenesis GTPase Der [Clostridiales bacterium]|nr:ribosome biogenesis GTPase Der [Clostridiales bacterium]HBM81343.1 ribosome biogenesis GTPase Der [Clostridiaceae bacterium]